MTVFRLSDDTAVSQSFASALDPYGTVRIAEGRRGNADARDIHAVFERYQYALTASFGLIVIFVSVLKGIGIFSA